MEVVATVNKPVRKMVIDLIQNNIQKFKYDVVFFFTDWTGLLDL